MSEGVTAGPYAALDWTFRVTGSPRPVAFLAERFRLLRSEVADVSVVEVSVVEIEDVAGGDWALTIDGVTMVRGRPGDVVARLIESMNRRAVASVGHGLPVHAGAVATAGRALVLFGASRSGKSTLTAACVQAGLGYVADEIALVSADPLGVRPYCRPIGLRPGGASALGMAVEEAGPCAEIHPWVPLDAPWTESKSRTMPVRACVHIERVDGRPSITPISAANGLALLAGHTMWPPEPRDAFQLATLLCRTVPMYRLRYGEAIEAVRLLAEL